VCDLVELVCPCLVLLNVVCCVVHPHPFMCCNTHMLLIGAACCSCVSMHGGWQSRCCKAHRGIRSGKRAVPLLCYSKLQQLLPVGSCVEAMLFMAGSWC